MNVLSDLLAPAPQPPFHVGTDGKSSKNTPNESPASMWSNSVLTGTRVPVNTGIPLKISGETVMRCVVVSISL
jgi:hypothetical protein